MKKITLILIFIINTIAYSQDKEYVDDFGNVLSKTEFKKLKEKGGFVIRLKKNKRFNKGIIPREYYGQISDSLKSSILNFLESNSNFKVSPNDKIIINYAIDHKCNIINGPNNSNFKLYLKTITKNKDLALFIVIDDYDDKAKNQIVDRYDLIKNNFFKYIHWDLDSQYKCGGVLLIYPDNTFLRIYGEYNPMDIFDRVKKHTKNKV